MYFDGLMFLSDLYASVRVHLFTLMVLLVWSSAETAEADLPGCLPFVVSIKSKFV